MPWTSSAHGMFTYFVLQIPVIRLEDYVVDFGRQQGVKSSGEFEGFDAGGGANCC